jgi:hypothetical protein
MSKVGLGISLLVIGAIGLVAIYSMRPPSGFGEALMMLGQGRRHYINEPFYQIFMTIAGVVTVAGIIQIVAGVSSRRPSEG